MVSMTWPATHHDGREADSRRVSVRIGGDALYWHADEAGHGHQAPLRRLAISDRFAGAPRAIDLPGGERLWVHDPDGSFDAALRAAGAQRGRVAAAIASWPAAVVALLVPLALLVAFQWRGAAWSAGAVLPLIPPSIDEQLSRQAAELLDAKWFEPTRIAPERIARLQERLRAIAQAYAPHVPLKIEFRAAGKDGDTVNALALPDGTVILFDGLVMRTSDDELLAVLAHELGHVHHRHAMRGRVQALGTLVLAGVVWRDLSFVAAIAAAMVAWTGHSRDQEREADAYAREFLVKAGLRPESLAAALRKMQQATAGAGANENGILAWLSTHPPTEERIRAAEQAASR
jgi:Zn-dependent protease with chaperone function